MTYILPTVLPPMPCTFCKGEVEDRAFCAWCGATTCALNPCQQEHFTHCGDARNQE